MKNENLEALVIAGDHYNTLNVVRALGSDGIRVTVVGTHKSKKNFVVKSRLIDKAYMVESLTADWLIVEIGQKSDAYRCWLPTMR